MLLKQVLSFLKSSWTTRMPMVVAVLVAMLFMAPANIAPPEAESKASELQTPALQGLARDLARLSLTPSTFTTVPALSPIAAPPEVVEAVEATGISSDSGSTNSTQPAPNATSNATSESGQDQSSNSTASENATTAPQAEDSSAQTQAAVQPGYLQVVCDALASMIRGGEINLAISDCPPAIPDLLGPCDPDLVPVSVDVPGYCGEPLPSTDLCQLLRNYLTGQGIPGFCGAPLPSTNACSYDVVDNANTPGLCQDPIPPTDPCYYWQEFFTGEEIPGWCGAPMPSTKPCDYEAVDDADLPGTCGQPTPKVGTNCADGSVGVTLDGFDVLCEGTVSEWISCAMAASASLLATTPTESCTPESHDCIDPPGMNLCQLMASITQSASSLLMTFDETVDVANGGKEDASDQVNEANQARPRPSSTYCEARTTTAAEGAWKIVLPSNEFSTLTPQPVAAEKQQYVSFGKLSLDIPDHGVNSQQICFIPGSWVPIAPTELPPKASDKSHVREMCIGGIGLVFLGVVMIAAAGALVYFSGTAATPGALSLAGFGASMAASGGVMALDNCGKHASMQRDLGYMRCQGNAKVTWGGAPSGNSFDSTILELNSGQAIEGPMGTYVSLTSHSHGGGYWEEVYPDPAEMTYLYDAPDYYLGESACIQRMEDANQAAWIRFQEVMSTASDGDDSATADLTATIRIHDAGEAYNGAMTEIAQGVFIPDLGPDVSPGFVLIGCEEAPCDLEVSLSVIACGKQITTAGANGLVYDFVGKQGCINVVLRIDDEEVNLGGIPLLRLDAHFGGQADRVTTGHFVDDVGGLDS